MRKTILILILFVSVGARSQESKTHSFSLKEAITHALQHNYDAINAGRDIDKAKQKKWETTASGLPQINAGVDYINNFVLQKSLIPAEFFGGEPGTFTAVEFGTKHNMTAHATLSQLIFDGSYIVALRASKTYLEYYRNTKQKTDNDVRQAVIEAYGNVLLANESVVILERNKTTLDKTLSDTRETFKNGLIEEENVEQLQITQYTVNSSLNNARRMKEISLNFLKLQLGIPIDESLTLTDNLEDLTRNNLDMALTQSEFKIENNIDFQLMQNFNTQRKLELQLEKSKALPSLSANLNFGYNGFGNKFNFTSPHQEWFNYSNLGVSLNVPIFSSFARSARTQQAKIAYDQAKTQLEKTEQSLKLQYANARSQYEFSVEEFSNAKNNLELAERIERKQQTKFTEGLSSSFDFAEAQRQLYTAQQNYLQSMINVITRRSELERITTTN
ncbi:MAG: TolC family protein [Flavobacterium sp.]|nr:MAG: TolC family protein [Flavobacterium sp.]